MGIIEHNRLRRKVAKAILAGAKVLSATRFRWELHGSCAGPVEITHYSRPAAKGEDRYVTVDPRRTKPLELTYSVKCGRCTECLAKRKRVWAARAIAVARSTHELGRRTWFATLTCSPDYLHIARSRARAKQAVSGEDFDSDRPERQFRELDHAIYRDISKYLKRLRKGKADIAPARFTFFCVTEAHQSGEPHYHLLIHEQDASSPLRKRMLREARWAGGFAAFKLVEDERHAAYCCKYLTKALGRVRASIHYGKSLHHSENASNGRNDEPVLESEASNP